ncbi:hypothetical protein ACMHYB_00390 [Sorangium sp. So ce1128]
MLGGFFVHGPDEGDGSCWGAGGGLNGGSLKIVKINGHHVVFRLEGTQGAFFGFDADGDYEADLCPGGA